jgi:hypothetical protein
MGAGPRGSVGMAFFGIGDERRGLSRVVAWGWPFFGIRDERWGLALVVTGDGPFFG